jgi:hypothetical protein
MAATRLTAFGGIRPKLSAYLLGDNEAQVADNCKLFSGELRSWRRPTVIATPTKAGTGTVKTIFKLLYLGVAYWLNWTKDVNVQPGPVAADVLQRLYYTGDGEPRMTYNTLATQSGIDYPVASHVLGVFPPSAAASLVVTGGAGAIVTRSYVYTFVTALGEESQPSPPVTVSDNVDGSWDLSNMQTAPANTFVVTGSAWAAGVATLTVGSSRGLRVGEEVDVTGMTPAGFNGTKKPITALTPTTVSYALAANPGAFAVGGQIARVATHNTAGMRKRIYRIATGTAGAEYQFVTEIAVATTTHSDTLADSALGEVLPSEDWEMPPTDMKCLVSGSNGMMAGLSKNELCVCEPFRPHAWPSPYRIAYQHEPVAVESFSGGFVVATKGKPAVVVGSSPGNLSSEDVEVLEPCMSKRGTVSLGFGVIFPSPNGWVLSGIGGTVLASADVVTKTEFADFMPDTMIGAAYQGRYFAWYTDGDGVVRGLVFDKSGAGPTLTPLQQAADAAWTDPQSGELYIVHDGLIKLWDGDDLNFLPYDWRSKVLSFPDPVNLSACRVRAKYSLLGDSEAEQAQLAADAIFNAAILALPDVYPGQSNTKGDFGGSMLGEFMLGGSLLRDAQFPQFDDRVLQLLLYAMDDEGREMELKHTETLTDDKPFRLPDGYTASEYEVRLLGNIDVRSVELAESMRELKVV